MIDKLHVASLDIASLNISSFGRSQITQLCLAVQWLIIDCFGDIINSKLTLMS